jgi:hypothetical protein
VNDEVEDKAKFKAQLAEMESKLDQVRLIVNASPEKLYDLQQKVETTKRKANETAQSIRTLKARQSDIEGELELARASAQAHQDGHVAHMSDINKDIAILDEVFELLDGVCPSNSGEAAAYMNMISPALAMPAPSSLLQLSSSQGGSCTVNGQVIPTPAGCENAQPLCCGTDGVLSTCPSQCVSFATTCCPSGGSGSDDDDPCTSQHGQAGREYCNDPVWCGNPLSCSQCKYDEATDHCYTESCDARKQFVNSACLDSDGCLTSTPSSQCCERVRQFSSGNCTASVCGTMVGSYASRCSPTPEVPTQDAGACRALSILLDELNVAKHHEDTTHMLELSEIHQEKHVLESDLQSVVNEVTSLEATKRGLEHKAIEYTAQLDVLQTHTIAEAEALLTTLPTTISNHKHQRQDRKEARQRQLQLITTVINMLSDMGVAAHEEPPLIPEDSSTLQCYSFKEPGYFYHPNGPQPKVVSCPDDVKCGIEKVVMNPMDNPSIYIVRMGCYGELAQDPDQCGAAQCPSSNHMTLVECCSGPLCNALDAKLATQNPGVGDCNPDPDICACSTSYRGDAMKPSPFPSKSPFPSPTMTATRSMSPSASASNSVTISTSPSPSPTPSPYALSCETIKAGNDAALSGMYVVTLGMPNPITVYCDMDTDDGAGYTLIWKNVGGTLGNTTGLKSNKELMQSGKDDIVLPPFASGIQDVPDLSSFSTSAYEYYTASDRVEWIKYMVLYDTADMVRGQVVKVVMEGVTMDDVFNSAGKGHCVHTAGQFNLYGAEDQSQSVNRLMGRTSLVDSGYESGGGSSFGLPTAQENRCPNALTSNVITDATSLRRLTDDLQLATNEAWGTVQHLFGYDHDTVNPRDYSRCMFRCWNGHDGAFHETFVWGARLGCPGFLFSTGERCSGHGRCSGGVCECDPGWSGPGCAAKYIAPRCGACPSLEHGTEECSDTRCDLKCDAGYEIQGPSSWQCSDEKQWVGPGLSKCVPVCTGNCSNHGECVAPETCKCDPAWVGPTCATKSCLEPLVRLPHGTLSCDGQGTLNHKCNATCDADYSLEGGSVVWCKNGLWDVAPVCKPLCPPDDCSRHGTCQAPGVCQCWEGFKGDACQYPDCNHVSQCSEHGICVSTDVCLCDEGWDGPRCDLPVSQLDEIALQLSGPANQAIILPPMGEMGHVTIEFWMFVEKVTLESGRHMLLESTNDVPGSINVGIVDSHLVVTAPQVANLTLQSLVPPGWSHVAVICSPTKLRVVMNSEAEGETLLTFPAGWSLPETRLGGGVRSLPFLGLVKELRVWNETRSWNQITTNAFRTIAIDPLLIAHYPMNGPLSSTASYLDDTTGRHPVRVLGGNWAVAPTAPPGPHLPIVYHSTPEE